MNKEEFFSWLEEKNLMDIARLNFASFSKVYEQCLSVNGEKVLLIGDLGKDDKQVPALMLGCYILAADDLGIEYDLVIGTPKERGDKADDNIIKALVELEEGSVIIMALSEKLGGIGELGKSFRKYVKKNKHRFCSTTNLLNLANDNFYYLANSVDVDYEKMHDEAIILKEQLDSAKEITVKTEKGTNLTYNIEGMTAIANDGRYTKPGMGGNIPAGEVYIPCNEDKVDGRIVVDASLRIRESTILLDDPVILDVEKGGVVKIDGGEPGELLEESFQWAFDNSRNKSGVRRLSEFGIGINPNARVIGPTIINEKTKNTAHVATGSNSWFGGNIFAIIHLDHVFYDPEITLDGKAIEI